MPDSPEPTFTLLNITYVKRNTLAMDYYRPQRSWAKAMFLQTSVILSTGGGRVSASVHAGMPDPPLGAGTPPPPGSRPPQIRHTPPTRHPPGPGTPPPHPPGSRRQHTVNERPVRILLECILVQLCMYLFSLLKFLVINSNCTRRPMCALECDHQKYSSSDKM